MHKNINEKTAEISIGKFQYKISGNVINWNGNDNIKPKIVTNKTVLELENLLNNNRA